MWYRFVLGRTQGKDLSVNGSLVGMFGKIIIIEKKYLEN
jgi:hypothetical protein